jgi:hypothetical protein
MNELSKQVYLLTFKRIVPLKIMQINKKYYTSWK